MSNNKNNRDSISGINEISFGDVYINELPDNPKTGDKCLIKGEIYFYIYNEGWISESGKTIKNT